MLTIVMPFHKQEEMAKVSLLLLKEKSTKAYPVIVVDSEPNTTNMEQFLDRWLNWGPTTYLPRSGCAPAEAIAVGLELAQTEIVVYLHQDTMVLENGWDKRLVTEMKRDKNLVLCGLYGFQFYQKGFTDRTGWRKSNMVEAEYHGARLANFQYAAGIDGFFMALRRKFYAGRVDPKLRFHFYDYDLSLQAHAEGTRVGVLGLRCHHNRATTAPPTPEDCAYLTAKWGNDLRVQEWQSV